jgi:hypothetical protein
MQKNLMSTLSHVTVYTEEIWFQTGFREGIIHARQWAQHVSKAINHSDWCPPYPIWLLPITYSTRSIADQLLSHTIKSQRQPSSIHEKYTATISSARPKWANKHTDREKNETIRHTHARTRINLKNNDGNALSVCCQPGIWGAFHHSAARKRSKFRVAQLKWCSVVWKHLTSSEN